MTEYAELHQNEVGYSTEEIPAAQKKDKTSAKKPKKKFNATAVRAGWAKGIRYYLDGVLYGSKSEAACGAILEKCVQGFTLIQGQTFQVSLGFDSYRNELTVDFLVHGVLIEYHPLAPGSNPEAKDHYYSKRRRQVLDSPVHADKELIVVFSPHEFMQKVLRRFCAAYDEELIREFSRIQCCAERSYITEKDLQALQQEAQR